MTNKIIQNHMKLIISIFIILCITIIGILAYLMTVPYSKIPQYIENEMNNGLSFTRDGDVPIDGIKGYTLGRDYKIVQSKFDYFQPVYAMVVSSSSDEKSENLPIIRVRQIYLQRQGIDTWKVTKYLDNQVNGLNYKEVIDLASQYDLTTDFPGKEKYKITNYPPLTPEEIESNRKLREKSIEAEKNNQILDEQRKVFENSSIPDKIKSLEVDIARREAFIKAYKENGTLPAGTTKENVEGYIAKIEVFVEQNKSDLENLKNQLK
jgi:hypothetical protein